MNFRQVISKVPIPMFRRIDTKNRIQMDLRAGLSQRQGPTVLALHFNFRRRRILTILNKANRVTTRYSFLANRVIFNQVMSISTNSIRYNHNLRIISNQLRTRKVTAPFRVRVINSRLIIVDMFTRGVKLPLRRNARLVTARLIRFTTRKLIGHNNRVQRILPKVSTIQPMIGARTVIRLIRVTVRLLVRVLSR